MIIWRPLGDEKKHQGQPHDLKAFDEIAHFFESQFRYLIGWNRSGKPGQRCRVVAASNPPTDPEGEWVLRFWAPWLDEKHPRPAKPGELRWFTTIGDNDEEVPDGRPFVIENGERKYSFDLAAYRPQDVHKPLSRTFIPASVEDNSVYMAGGYVATLQALPEPLRSKLLFGSFAAGRVDSPDQVIPTAWVQAAQERWKARTKPTTPLSALGVDVARGGRDKTVLTERYDNWFGEQHVHPGTETPNGPAVLQLIVALLNGRKPKVNIDVIGVGSSVYDSAHDLIGSDAVAMNASEKSEARDKSGKLGFVNRRAEWWWKFREALDPDSGDDIALPPDRELLADLTAPTWRLRMNGIQIESKDEIVARLQRSPDKGESLVYAASVPFVPGTGVLNYYCAAAAKAAAKKAAPETIRLRVPQGQGGVTLMDGTHVDADADGLIAVPVDHVNRLVAAGYARVDALLTPG